MSRPLWTVSLFRPNVALKPASVARDVWEIVQFGVLCFVYFVLGVILLGGF